MNLIQKERLQNALGNIPEDAIIDLVKELMNESWNAALDDAAKVICKHRKYEPCEKCREKFLPLKKSF